MPTDPWAVIWLHVLTAVPPTLAAVAALITAVKTKTKTNEIHVLVNGERVKLMQELHALRVELAERSK